MRKPKPTAVSEHICGVTDALKGEYGEIVLVLQGGGALGAYQAGIYEALHRAGLEPDRVVGTSIGAINGALIMGNPREKRLERLREFWRRMEFGGGLPMPGMMRPAFSAFETASLFLTGLPHFFAPNYEALAAPYLQTPGHAGYYSTAALRSTLESLVEFPHFDSGIGRLTVGAARISTSEMRYFDSRDIKLRLDHVLASAALPPAFPAVDIDGEAYWDGGILSNSPIEAVFDDKDRRSGLVFVSNVWQARGEAPSRLADVAARQKDVTYASRMESHVERQRQIHRLRHVIAELARRMPAGTKPNAELLALMDYGCMTRMHVMSLNLPPMPAETSLKDVDFSPQTLAARWAEGLQQGSRVVEAAPWTLPFNPLEGLILHEAGKG